MRIATAGAVAGATALLLVVITRGDDAPGGAAVAGQPDAVVAAVAASSDAAAVVAQPFDAAVQDAASSEASPAVAAAADGATPSSIEATAPPANARVAAPPRVMVELDVFCLDSSCDVFVDGVKKGSTPVTTRVPAGVHTVRLQHPENKGLRVQRRITVKAGQKNEISHSWNP